jgi:hypothetical protein
MTFFYLNEYPDSWVINALSIGVIPFVYLSFKTIDYEFSSIEKWLTLLFEIFAIILSSQVIVSFINSVIIKQLEWNYVKWLKKINFSFSKQYKSR